MTRTSSGISPFSAPSRKSWSIEVRKAASVFPEPVGAAMSVCSPRRMADQPSAWAAVGSPKRPSHQRRSTGWKSWGSKPTFYPLNPRVHPPQPVRHHLHDEEREVGRGLHHEEEALLGDDGELARRLGDGGGGARRLVDQGHLAERLARPEELQHLAVDRELDLALEHDVHLEAHVEGVEDRLAGYAVSRVLLVREHVQLDAH